MKKNLKLLYIALKKIVVNINIFNIYIIGIMNINLDLKVNIKQKTNICI